MGAVASSGMTTASSEVCCAARGNDDSVDVVPSTEDQSPLAAVSPPLNGPSEWLDDIQKGWGERYGTAFEEFGCETRGEVSLLVPSEQEALLETLQASGTKPMHLRRIRQALERDGSPDVSPVSSNQRPSHSKETTQSRNNTFELDCGPGESSAPSLTLSPTSTRRTAPALLHNSDLCTSHGECRLLHEPTPTPRGHSAVAEKEQAPTKRFAAFLSHYKAECATEEPLPLFPSHVLDSSGATNVAFNLAFSGTPMPH